MHIGYAPGWQELVLVLAVILLLFGAKRLPELARALGKSLREFKKGREDAEDSGEKKPPAPPAIPTL